MSRWKDDETDLILAKILMLAGWDTSKNEVNGVHALIAPGKLRCPARSRSQRWVDSWKWLESEKMDCSRENGL